MNTADVTVTVEGGPETTSPRDLSPPVVARLPVETIPLNETVLVEGVNVKPPVDLARALVNGLE